MKFGKSRKNKIQILLDGYSYNRHTVENYWRCSFKNSCNGLGYYQHGIFKIVTAHRNVANVGLVKAKVAKLDILAYAETSSLKPSEIVSEKIGNLVQGKFWFLFYEVVLNWFKKLKIFSIVLYNKQLALIVSLYRF